MLIKDFYTLEEFSSDENKVFAKIRLNSEHDVYKGHFPGQPVVPGVIQMLIIKEVLEECLKQHLFLKKITLAKYLQPVDPVLFPELEISIDYSLFEEKSYKINALITTKEIAFSKIKALVNVRL